MDQVEKYRDFYRKRRWRWLFRFDVRYRCMRLPEVLSMLNIPTAGRSVLDVGFGSGKLLKVFPSSCRITGAEISESAVTHAGTDEDFQPYRDARFVLVGEEAEELPGGPFDIIVSSHTIEHVPNDMALLRAIRNRLAPDGVLVLFAPIEEPNYIPQHVRNYATLEVLKERVVSAGFRTLFAESSMHINGHIWKVITIPSRRQWPVLKPIVDAVRSVSLSLIPYRAKRLLDQGLERLGVGPRQGLIVAKRA